MRVGLKYTSDRFYEYFAKYFDDDMTLKEIRELIEHYSLYWLEQYLQGLSNYTEKEKEELLNTFTRENGVCRWTIEEDVYF